MLRKRNVEQHIRYSIEFCDRPYILERTSIKQIPHDSPSLKIPTWKLPN